MRRNWQEICEVTEQRRQHNGALLNEMIQVRNRYNGDVVIPIGETDTGVQLPPITPALVAESIDNVSLRAASVMPSIDVPPIDPSKQEGRRSRAYATKRRDVYGGTWFASQLPIVLRRSFRHLSGYASTTLIVVPDHERQMPIIELRDPLGTYPEGKAPEDLSPPRDCAMVYERSASWIRANFPKSRTEYGGPIGVLGATELWDLVEWVDEYCCCIGILGPRDVHGQSAKEVARTQVAPSLELDWWPNRIGRAPLVTMDRVTLDKISSQIAHNVGIVDLMAKMMALSIIAEEKAVFPDRFLLARPGEAARIISNGGQWQDGRSGQTNIIDGVANIGQLDSAPPQSTRQTIDSLERNFRVSTGLVPQFGGETSGALRTGRGMDAMMGVAVDPRVQELQEIMAMGLSHINSIVGDMWKEYWPDTKTKLFSGLGGKAKVVEFQAEEIFEDTANVVAYAIPGADVQSVTIQLGQLLGANAIGLRSFREKHPWIGDAEAEAKLVDEETLERAALEAIVQQTASGQIPLIMLAKLEKHRRSGTGDIFEAIEKAQEELQAEQAKQLEEQQAAAPPAPEAMPGLAAGPSPMPQGGPLPTEAPIAPTEGQQGLSSLVSALQAGG